MINSRVLVLAPHLFYPTRNGADILIDRRWAEFSNHVSHVDILGGDVLVRYKGGASISFDRYSNEIRSRLSASFRTAITGSHYLLQKLVTPAFKRKAMECLANRDYGLIVYSYISTASLAPLDDTCPCRLHCIETHNDEIKWFIDMGVSSANALVKLVAWLSARWLRRFMQESGAHFLYLHVSQTDQLGYARFFPSHISYVAPVGCDIEAVLPRQDSLMMDRDRAVRLLFVGSLSVKMNYDAIKYFSEEFYAVILSGLLGHVEVRIVGSNPTAQVVQLCAQRGWHLFANQSDSELAASYRWADFSILPFAYSTGGKLKLLKSLSQGVPFLATEAVSGQLDEVAQTCLFSNHAPDWVRHIKKIREAGITQSERERLVSCARQNSWSRIAGNLYEFLAARAKY